MEDSDLDPKEFYTDFEHVCQMCADGQGTAPKEKFRVLLQSLRGHRRAIYNYVVRENYELAQTDEGADQ